MNKGQRLLRILDRVIAVPKSAVTLSHLWATVFEIPADAGNHEHDDELVPCLQALRSEIGATRTALQAKGIPPEMYETALHSFASIAAPGWLLQRWEGQHGNIVPPHIRLAVQWIAWALDDEEDEIPAEVLAGLMEDLVALEASAQAEGVAPFVRDLTLRNAATIRAALRLYGVRGLQTVSEALQSVTGSLVASKSAAAEAVSSGTAETKTAMGRLTSLLTKVVKVAEGADKVHKGIEASKNIYRGLEGAWNGLPQLPWP